MVERNLGLIGCQRVEEHAERSVKADIDLCWICLDGNYDTVAPRRWQDSIVAPMQNEIAELPEGALRPLYRSTDSCSNYHTRPSPTSASFGRDRHETRHRHRGNHEARGNRDYMRLSGQSPH